MLARVWSGSGDRRTGYSPGTLPEMSNIPIRKDIFCMISMVFDLVSRPIRLFAAKTELQSEFAPDSMEI